MQNSLFIFDYKGYLTLYMNKEFFFGDKGCLFCVSNATPHNQRFKIPFVKQYNKNFY